MNPQSLSESQALTGKPFNPFEYTEEEIAEARKNAVRSCEAQTQAAEVAEVAETAETAETKIEELEHEVDDLRLTATIRSDEAIAAKADADQQFLENYCLKHNKRMPQTKEAVEKFARLIRKRELAELDAKANANKNEYALTPLEYAEEMEKEYPVIPLVSQIGPSWDDGILYGKAGELTRKICQYNEAHPVGVMLDLLVSLGSLFGPNPHFLINSTRHGTNEFVARIGETSRGRKGSGRDAVDEVLKLVDRDWYRDKVQSGFGSGESIVNEIRDSSVTTITDTKKGTSKDVVKPGVTDKRLFIREGELSRVFVLASKEGGTASAILRDGWDSKPLRNKVKGAANNGLSNSCVCMSPHLSLSGDITASELKKTMPDGSDSNGFANRFLYVYTSRVKLCPQGGPPLHLTDEVVYFYEAVQMAQKRSLVPLSSNARKLWAKMYMSLDDDQAEGIVGAMTARAAVHIRRLAMIIALVEKSGVVEVEHLRAAESLWDYCCDSVKYVFTKTTRDQERVLCWIGRESTLGKAVTLRRVREELYGKHKTAEWVRGQIEPLIQQGKLTLADQVITLVQGPSREIEGGCANFGCTHPKSCFQGAQLWMRNRAKSGRKFYNFGTGCAGAHVIRGRHKLFSMYYIYIFHLLGRIHFCAPHSWSYMATGKQCALCAPRTKGERQIHGQMADSVRKNGCTLVRGKLGRNLTESP